MSVDLALAEDHDLALDLLGRTALVGGARRVRQQVKVTLMTFLGEWFLDTSFGVPYFEQILLKTPDRTSIEVVLRARILAVPGVVRVRRLDLQVDAVQRALRVNFEAETAAALVADSVVLRAP